MDTYNKESESLQNNNEDVLSETLSEEQAVEVIDTETVATEEKSEVCEEVKEEKGEEKPSKKASKLSKKKLLYIVIAAVLLVVIGVGVGLGVGLTRQNTPEKALVNYCEAYNNADAAKLEKTVFEAIPDGAFDVVVNYEVVSFELKSKNDTYAFADVVLKCTLASGKTVEDSFAIYFKKDGLNWELFSVIDLENRCTNFISFQ